MIVARIREKRRGDCQPIQSDARRTAEVGRPAGIRRLYLYLVAAIGLGAFLIGLARPASAGTTVGIIVLAVVGLIALLTLAGPLVGRMFAG